MWPQMLQLSYTIWLHWLARGRSWRLQLIWRSCRLEMYCSTGNILWILTQISIKLAVEQRGRFSIWFNELDLNWWMPTVLSFFSSFRLFSKFLGRESWKDFAIHGSTFPSTPPQPLIYIINHPHACIKHSSTRCWVSKRRIDFSSENSRPKRYSHSVERKKEIFWVKLLFSISILVYPSFMNFLPVLLCCHHSIA